MATSVRSWAPLKARASSGATSSAKKCSCTPAPGLLTENLRLRVLPGGTPVPIPLTGGCRASTCLVDVPGFGPAVQLPLDGWLMTNKPGPQFVKEALGELEMADLGSLGTVEEVLLPFGRRAEDRRSCGTPAPTCPRG